MWNHLGRAWDNVGGPALERHTLPAAAPTCAPQAARASVSARRRPHTPWAACWLHRALCTAPHVHSCWGEPAAEPALPCQSARASAEGHAPWPSSAWPHATRQGRLRANVATQAAVRVAVPSRPADAALAGLPQRQAPPPPVQQSAATPLERLGQLEQLLAKRGWGDAELAAAPRRPQHAGAEQPPHPASAPPRPGPSPPPGGSLPPAAPTARPGPVQVAPPSRKNPNSGSVSSRSPPFAGSTSGGGGGGGGGGPQRSSSSGGPATHAPAALPPPPALASQRQLTLLAPAPPKLRLQPRVKRPPPPPKRPTPVFDDSDPRAAQAYGDLPLSVRGRAPPSPLSSFNQLVSKEYRPAPWPVARLLMCNVAAAYRLGRPTPVQSHVIPAIMEGRDVLAVSCTGSGKTLAYLLPLLAQLYSRQHRASKNSAWPEALVVVPTRELAEQVFSEARLLLRGSHLRALLAIGGVSVAEQMLAIRGSQRRSGGGVALVVATPGRLLQLVQERKRIRLGRLSCVVLDEADRMVELGMWPEMRRLLLHPSLPTARQTVLVSSSLPAPELRAQAEALLRDPLVVEVGDGSGASRVVRQRVERLRESEKLERLVELLAPRGAATEGVAGAAATAAAAGGPGAAPAPAGSSASSRGEQGGEDDVAALVGDGPAVVFVGSLSRAEQVARYLAGRGVTVALLHRELSQAQRDEALQCFRFGVASVLVATSLAARGLNFPDVAHVVNFDVPLTFNDYIHQVGRTGRGGRPGLATTLYTPSRFNRSAAPWLRDALRAAGSPVPHWLTCLAGEAEARQWTERTRRQNAYAAKPAARGSSVAGQGREQRQAEASASGGGERGEAAHGGPRGGSPRQRDQVVDLGDPDAASRAAFGTYQRSSPASGVWESSLLLGGTAAAAAGERSVVRDRRHDPAHWQAVFDAAVRGQAPQAQPQSAQQRRPQPREPGAAAAPEPEPGAQREDARRRLVFQNGAVALEAGPTGGLSAGAGAPPRR